MTPAPPPPATAVKPPVAFYDTECYPNYWLLKIKPRGGPVYAFRLLEGETFPQHQIDRMLLMFSAYTVISFNGLGYDVPMITAALMGYNPSQLKWLNDRIIVEQTKPWDLGLPEWKPSDHIDVMEVAPGAGSQKQYAGRIHCKKMQDLPYDPGTRLTPEQIADVDLYCENDLSVLEELFDALAPQIRQREALGARYNIDLRSKSDAQVAETVLRKRCEQVLGKRIYKPEIDWNLKFRYKMPEFIAFSTPILRRLYDAIQTSIFELGANGTVKMPAQLEGFTVPLGGSVYKVGIGGLHSQESRSVHESDENFVLRDNDVASYYPSLILNSGAWPAALGETFLHEYAIIKRERLHAKEQSGIIKKRLVLLENELKNAEAREKIS